MRRWLPRPYFCDMMFLVCPGQTAVLSNTWQCLRNSFDMQRTTTEQQQRKLMKSGPKMQSVQQRVHDDRNIDRGSCGYESVTRAHTYAKTEKNNNDVTIRQKSRSAMHRCIFKVGETTSPGIRRRSTIHRRCIVLWILFEPTQAIYNQ